MVMVCVVAVGRVFTVLGCEEESVGVVLGTRNKTKHVKVV
jgi:hypothetical protein